MCSPGYHHNGFMKTVPKWINCHKTMLVIINRMAHCFHGYILHPSSSERFEHDTK